MMEPYLESAEQELFPRAGKGAFAAALGIDPATLWRYGRKESLPGPVAATIEAWLRLRREQGVTPPAKPCSMDTIQELAEMAVPGTLQESGLLGVQAAAFAVFGHKWKAPLTAALGIDYSTLWRQIIAGNVQGPVMAALRAWLVIKRLSGDTPQPMQTSKPKKKSVPKYARLLLDD
jgi:hypothetical protein